MHNIQYDSDIYEYFGIQTYWSNPSQGTGTINSSDLIGKLVRNRRGGMLGVVSQVMIDSEGHAFAIVNHQGNDMYGMEGVYTPVPFAALRITETASGHEKIVLHHDLQNLPSAQ